MLKSKLGARYQVQQGLPPTHKKIEDDHAIEGEKESLKKTRLKIKLGEALSKKTTAK